MLWEMQLEIIGEVALAILLGGLIGLEREIAKKPAGVRTNMLIAGAAALLVSLGDIQVARFENSDIQEFIGTDPIRTIEAIIVGLSFIGAGTIIQRTQEEKVENLTTAASFLFTAGIGMAASLDQYYLAGGLTIIVLIINFGFGMIVDKIKRRTKK